MPNIFQALHYVIESRSRWIHMIPNPIDLTVDKEGKPLNRSCKFDSRFMRERSGYSVNVQQADLTWTCDL